MLKTIKTYTSDMMSFELLPSYALDVQKRIADTSDMIFKLQHNRMPEKAISILTLASQQLQVNGLSRYKGYVGAISYARLIDKAEKADKEAQKISESFQKIYIGLCKENMLLDTMKKVLENSITEIQAASDALSENMKNIPNNADWKYYQILADKRLNDLILSKNIASQSIFMISGMYTRNSEMSQRIESLKVNTLVLWRAGIEALRNTPDKDNMDKVCGIEDVISAAIANIIK
ncbi:hypothetical protein RASY3_13735 [Ruminococcus albus SY3]|uniref:Toxic anion resistance protein n=1 Tax=Ruminococcus albus SY3 TaxID=1341156 RepID=A0A011UZ27_RUMAL|nr:hypothetical protein [Ruminococcus albus]EXM38447.1 hypothetical protein RASY3_13735 [Ruminococcus albus SY3]